MTTSGQIQRSIQHFLDFGSDLITSDSDTFDDRLNLFLSYCQTDSVFNGIDAQLESLINDDFNQWYSERLDSVGSMAGSGNLLFPIDLEARLAYQYELLKRIQNGRIEFFHFSTVFFSSGTSVSAMVRNLNDAITRPMVRELTYRLQDLMESLPEDPRTVVPMTTIQIIHNANNVVQQNASGYQIQQTINNHLINHLEHDLNQLRNLIKNEINDDAIKKECEELVDAIISLSKDNELKKSAIKSLLETLSATANIATITSLILTILHQVK